MSRERRVFFIPRLKQSYLWKHDILYIHIHTHMYIYIYWTFSTYTFYALVFYDYSSTMRGHILKLAGFYDMVRRNKDTAMLRNFVNNFEPLGGWFLLILLLRFVGYVRWLTFNFSRRKNYHNHFKEIFDCNIIILFYHIWNLGKWLG